MKERPTLRQLEYFVALYERLNFRTAAEACYVTQPTLSVQLQQLEDLLGLRLFERTRRKVIPTAAGHALAPRARRALQLVDELLDEAQGQGAPLSGPLRLGVIPTIAPYLLPSVLGRLRDKFPALRLYLREDPTERLLDALQRGELDLLLLAREARLGDVVFIELFQDAFYLAVPREHRLSRRRRIAERDLESERLILLEDGH